MKLVTFGSPPERRRLPGGFFTLPYQTQRQQEQYLGQEMDAGCRVRVVHLPAGELNAPQGQRDSPVKVTVFL